MITALCIHKCFKIQVAATIVGLLQTLPVGPLLFVALNLHRLPNALSDCASSHLQYFPTAAVRFYARLQPCSGAPIADAPRIVRFGGEGCLLLFKMLVLVTGLVFILWGEPCFGGTFEFGGGFRHYAVASNYVYVATADSLHQLSHDLRLIQSLNQRGVLEKDKLPENERFHRVPVPGGVDATFSVNVLLPYVENKTLVTCGVTDNDCGYCEVLNLMNISNIQHSEMFQVGPPWRKSASVAFLVNVQESKNETYILSGIEQRGKPSTKSCTSGLDAVNLHNTRNDQVGSIFSTNSAKGSFPIKTVNRTVEFADGFQIGRIIYLFSNLPAGDKSNSVRLIWLEGEEGKKCTLSSLRGATLRVSEVERGSKLLASSVVPGGQQVLWSGVFSLSADQTNTQLALFDVSPDLTRKGDEDPDFCVVCKNRANSKVSITRKVEDSSFCKIKKVRFKQQCAGEDVILDFEKVTKIAQLRGMAEEVGRFSLIAACFQSQSGQSCRVRGQMRRPSEPANVFCFFLFPDII